MKWLGNNHGSSHPFMMMPLLAFLCTTALTASLVAQPSARQVAAGVNSLESKAAGKHSARREVKKAAKRDQTERPKKPRGPQAKIESRHLPQPSQQAPSPSYAGHELYEKLLQSSVRIVIDYSGDFSRYSSGTGWVVDEGAKLIVTNHHVVWKDGPIAMDAEIRVYFPETKKGKLITDPAYYLRQGKAHTATVIDTDALRDLAVLQLTQPGPELKALKLAAASAQPGDRVHSLGNPGTSGAMWVYNSGTVRQVYQAQATYRNGQSCDFLRVETQSPLNPGDSGGPVVNDQGRLVAVNQGHRTDANLVSYFIDVAEVKDFLQQTRPLLQAHTAEEYNDRGVHYYQRQRYARAVADLTKANQLDPTLADALGNRGWALVQLDDPDTALADFDAAIALESHDPNYYQGRAAAHSGKQDYESAVRDMTQAIRFNANEPEYYGDRADAHYEADEYDQAIADYSQALRLAPRQADYYNSRAVCHETLAQYDAAIADYDQAIQCDKENGAYYYNRAMANHRRGHDDLAARDFYWVEQLDPEYAKTNRTTYQRRKLRLTNDSEQPLKFWLKYHTQTTEGQWKWFPAAKEKWAVFIVEPGASLEPEHEGFPINANRLRVWACDDLEKWQNSTKIWNQHEEQPMQLVPEDGYQAYYMETKDLHFQ